MKQVLSLLIVGALMVSQVKSDLVFEDTILVLNADNFEEAKKANENLLVLFYMKQK